uniref:Uncharacterized protein MANES_08G008000 n=1 Tax=Rhizophora mucronata TaxID=61149 RepID=A0A2P2P060_RHIMU
MSTAAYASSPVLPSLNTKTSSFSNPNNPTSLSFLSPLSVSLKVHFKPIISVPTSAFRSSGTFQERFFCSRFVRNVAVSSELGEEEDALSEGDEPSFSENLKLFVGNLPFNVDSAQLAGLFENAGNVKMVEVIYDKVTGRSRGFGFVTMSSPEEVETAAQQFNGYELEGRPLRVNSRSPPQRDTSFSRGPRGGDAFDIANRVFVGNLSWGVDNLALETLFREQGKVLEAKVVYDRDSGRSRGFGFVTYSSAEEVNGAIESLNGVELDGRSIRVSVAEAKPRRQF